MSYFSLQKYHAQGFFSKLWFVTQKSTRRDEATRMAVEIEKREGRRNIRVRKEIDPFSESKNSHVVGGVKYEEVEDKNVRPVSGKLTGISLADIFCTQSFEYFCA